MLPALLRSMLPAVAVIPVMASLPRLGVSPPILRSPTKLLMTMSPASEDASRALISTLSSSSKAPMPVPACIVRLSPVMAASLSSRLLRMAFAATRVTVLPSSRLVRISTSLMLPSLLLTVTLAVAMMLSTVMSSSSLTWTDPVEVVALIVLTAVSIDVLASVPPTPMPVPAVMISSSALTRVLVSASLKMLPALAVSKMSPPSVPALSVPSVILPAIELSVISLLSLSVAEMTEVARMLPPAMMLIEPFSVRTSVSSISSLSVI